jgi:hypothetical protein
VGKGAGSSSRALPKAKRHVLLHRRLVGGAAAHAAAPAAAGQEGRPAGQQQGAEQQQGQGQQQEGQRGQRRLLQQAPSTRLPPHCYTPWGVFCRDPSVMYRTCKAHPSCCRAADASFMYHHVAA